jgi:outer membrane protein assembly factor BamB
MKRTILINILLLLVFVSLRLCSGQASAFGQIIFVDDMGADEYEPIIVVTRPEGGEVWVSGSMHEINWSSYGVKGTVDISYSDNNGIEWVAIENSVSNAGSYTWHLPDIVDSNQCLVLVVPSIPDPNVACIESGLFTIWPDNPDPAVESKWKTLGGDFKRSGSSYDDGPELGCVKWKFETEGAVSTSVTIGINGRVHIACEDGKLYTLNANGVLLWSYDANSPLISSPTVGPDGTVYVGSQDGTLFAIDGNGKLRWTHHTESIIYSSPAVAPDGKIYVCSQDGIVYALAHDGSELWSFETNGPAQLRSPIFASPAIGNDGTVYISGLYDPNLYALNPNDGSVKWACSFEFLIDPQQPWLGTKAGLPFASPVIAEDGTIYQTLLYDTNLYAIAPDDGTIIWSVNLAGRCEWLEECLEYSPLEYCLAWAKTAGECGDLLNYLEEYGDAGGWSEPALGPDGTIYVSLDDPYLRAVDPNGSIKWMTRLGMVGGFTLTVGDNGLIYAASDDGYLCVVNPDGEEIARFHSDRGLNFPVIQADNTIIVADGQDNTMLISDANNVVWAIGGEDCSDQMLVLHRPQDLDGSRAVNFIDFAVLATDWLECTDIYTSQSLCGYEVDEIYLAGDINRDLYVDVADLADLADKWLSGE